MGVACAGVLTRWLPVASLLVPVVACDRTEEPPAKPPRQVRAVQSEPETRPRPTPPSPRPCVVPTPVKAPPVAVRTLRCPRDPAPKLQDLPRAKLRFVGARSAPEITVELAQTPAQKAQGLMYRTQLGPREGMLFRWPNAQPRTFWMRNTCLPLDMLFIAPDGTIAGILEQVPTLNDAPRGIPCPANRVLEVNAGFCRKYGIKAGQKVALDAR